MSMYPENSIYIRGLKWAYQRHGQGFSKEEFRAALNITDERWDWAEWLFFNGIAGGSPLIWTPQTEYLRHGQSWGMIWYLSPTGMAAAVDYLELKEAQEGGKRAMTVAVISIIIGVFIGIAQIIVQVNSSPDNFINSHCTIYAHYRKNNFQKYEPPKGPSQFAILPSCVK